MANYEDNAREASAPTYPLVVEVTTDADPTDVLYFVAPPSYLGNQTNAAGLMITFEVKTNQQFNLQYGRDVIIAGNGLSLSKSYPRAPGTDWTPRRVFLDGSSG